MKRIALSLLVLLPALAFASAPATNAPAATPSRADVDAAVLAKLDRIIVPEFEFKNADICDVVSRLGDCSREFDDETAASERGVGFVLDLGGDASTLEEGEGLFAESPSSGVPPLTIKAKDRSLRALLDLVVEIADLKYRIEGGHVAIRRKDDMRGETFERWRFTILPDIVGRSDLIGEWMDFFGQLGVSWPPGTYAERSGDDGLVVRNTPENLNLIRMIFGALSVNVLRGDPVVLEDAPATNAPAATLEQLLAEPWRKRLSPDADPVAEMRKIGTLDAFADTRVLFLGAGVCLHHLRNDPEDIAPERDRCNLVRELFRETRPAAGIHFARGGSSRTLAFDVLPREGDPEWPDPVRAVPFEFDAFAPADFPEDLVVRLPGEDRWVRVPGLGEVAMPWRAAAHFLDTLVASFAVDSDANAIDIELADHKYKGLRFEECAIGEIRGVPRVERIQTLRSSFRLGAGRCVEFAEHHFGFIFSAYPRDGLPDDIRAALGPPETAPGPFLVVTRIGGFRRNYPMRYVLVPEDSPAAPNALRFSLGRFLLWPLDEDPEPHAAPAEEEPHAESAENAEPDPHAEPAWGDAMYFLDLLEWQKRNPDAFAAALAALAKDFATNAPVAEEMQ